MRLPIFSVASRRTILVSLSAACFLSLAFPELTAYASESEGWGIWGTVGKVFNLSLVVGILVYALRKPLCDYFESRRQSIRQEIDDARRAREEAERKLAEMEKRMASLDAELQELESRAAAEASEERSRIVAQADKDAAQLLENARKEADSLLRAGQMELRAYAAQLAVELAAEKIRAGLDGPGQQRLVENFTTQLTKLS